MNKQYIIDEKELKRLIDRDNELLRLEYNGVDNWGVMIWMVTKKKTL